MCSLKTRGGVFTGLLGGNGEVPIKQALPEILNAPSRVTYFQASEGEYLIAKGMGLNVNQTWVQMLGPPLPGFDHGQVIALL